MTKEKYFLDGSIAYNNGISKCNLEDFEGAIKDFDKAIELYKKYYTDANDFKIILAEAYNNRGVVNNILGYYKRAIKDFNKSIKLYKEKDEEKNKYYLAKVYNDIALSYSYLGNYEKTIENSEKSIQYNPCFGDAYLNIGLAKYNLTKNEEAIKDFDKAIEYYKKDKIHNIDNLAKAYNNIGLVNFSENNYKEAINNYLEALRYGDKFILF